MMPDLRLTLSKTCAATLLALSLATPGAAVACTQPANASALRAEVIAAVNAQRARAGLAKLSSSSALQKAAQGHACDIAAQGNPRSHVGRDGSQLQTRLKRAGYRFRSASENVGRFGTAARAIEWWMGSPAHRTNILQGNVREIGVGVAFGSGDQIYWVTVKGASR